MEILVSIFILSIGLLGVAALIPIGKLSLVETNKSDRGGMLGRAGLREVKARRMLDPNFLVDPQPRGLLPNNLPAVYAIDPLGVVVGGLTMNLGGTSLASGSPLFPLPRFSLSNATTTLAEQVFRWHDDLLYVQRADYTGSAAYPNGVRPIPVTDSGLTALGYSGPSAQGSDPSFSWFLTVSPAPWQPRAYEVSVVSCYKRLLTQTQTPGQPDGEQAVDIPSGGFLGGGYGGGTVQLSNSDTNLADPVNRLKDNQWVMLCGYVTDSSGNRTTIRCQWYRVVGVNRTNPPLPSPVSMLSLVGPDWDTNTFGTTTTLVVVDGVTGVYTDTVQLDSDEIWTK